MLDYMYYNTTELVTNTTELATNTTELVTNGTFFSGLCDSSSSVSDVNWLTFGANM